VPVLDQLAELKRIAIVPALNEEETVGRVIDEIRIELPQRDDPIARRREPRVNEYVARLMDRLDISHAGQHAAGASA